MSGRVLVTGGSQGIGLACAKHLAGEGRQIVLAARGEKHLESALAELSGDGHTALVLDVGDPAAWESHAEQFAELDGAVHAAGILGPIGPIEEIDSEAFESVLRTNVLGLALAAKSCLPALRISGGAIVAFSGGGATGPLPRFDAYACSKAALVRLVENLAADEVRINAVAPGFVATQMHAATLAAGPEAVGQDYFARTERELNEGGTSPQVAAELVSWLLSPQSAGISGRLISAPWDPWRESDFAERLRTQPDLACLRRIDDQFFTAVAES